MRKGLIHGSIVRASAEVNSESTGVPRQRFRDGLPDLHRAEQSSARRVAQSPGRDGRVAGRSGRQLRQGKVGVIPDHLAPILNRVGLDATAWCEVVSKFGRVFKRAVGTPESLAREATRRGQHWICALENPQGLSPG